MACHNVPHLIPVRPGPGMFQEALVPPSEAAIREEQPWAEEAWDSVWTEASPGKAASATPA